MPTNGYFLYLLLLYFVFISQEYASAWPTDTESVYLFVYEQKLNAQNAARDELECDHYPSALP